jgi:hypothetical protein
VDALGQKGQDITQGVVTSIFGTCDLQEVALAFHASDRLDAEIDRKLSITELVRLLLNPTPILLIGLHSAS